jgi:hypothetical protein
MRKYQRQYKKVESAQKPAQNTLRKRSDNLRPLEFASAHAARARCFSRPAASRSGGIYRNVISITTDSFIFAD